MTKIAFNACYGGFSLSTEAAVRYAEIKGIKLYPFVYGRKPGGGYDFNVHIPATADHAGELLHYSTTPDYADRTGWHGYGFYLDDIRTDPALIQVIEELGDRANGTHAELCIVDIPAGTKYRIDRYDGLEAVNTPDSYDWSIA